MRYASIRSMDISNGESVGVSLFVQGCHFHCKNCFNQSTWDFNGGKEWTKEKKQEFIELARRPYIKRISILGGEPLADENIHDVLDLVTALKNEFTNTIYSTNNELNHNILNKNDDKIRLCYENKKSIWIYTGYYWSELRDLYRDKFEVVKLCDVLVDGRYIDELKDPSYPWAGSINQSVIDIQKSLKSEYPILWK
ncbi:4Fe-4S single cluster domain-containing protein [Clostridium sp. HBUAS56010]|uniref:4Fe-4S single cluster domain-containing protein n=1 Tax=Clostridium sp. HBUAS56010 TaxID=2571127 RepID=UPI0011783D7D|nr:4Fe-4S single cluster domain-containing protein [Clostridium sp. HBUAS56010]